MTKTQLYAREGVAFDETAEVRDTAGNVVDLTGYALSLAMFKQAGDTAEFTLATGVSADAQGLHIVEGGLRIIIDKATLEGVDDDTGEFDLFGDLLGDDEGGTDYRFIADVRLNCTVAGRDFNGATFRVTLDALTAAKQAELQALVDEGAATAAAIAAAVQLWPDPFFGDSGGDGAYRVDGMRLYPISPTNVVNRSWAEGFTAGAARGAWVVQGDTTIGAFAVPLSGAAFDMSGIEDGDDMKVAYVHAAPSGVGVGIAAIFVDAGGSYVGSQVGTATATASGAVDALTSATFTKASGSAAVWIFAYSISTGKAIPVIDLHCGRAAAVPLLVARSLDQIHESLGRQSNAAGRSLSIRRTAVTQSALAVAKAVSGVGFVERGNNGYSGWGAVCDSPASISTNAVRIAAYKPVADSRRAAMLRFVWRTHATAPNGAGATIVAIADIFLDPAKDNAGGMVGLLRDPGSYAPITVTNTDLVAKSGLFLQAFHADGAYATMEECYGTIADFTSPVLYYADQITDVRAGAWSGNGAARNIGVEFLALTDPVETVMTEPGRTAARKAATLARDWVLNAPGMATVRAKLLAGASVRIGLTGDSQTDLGPRMLGGLRDAFGSLISNGGYCGASTAVYVPTDKDTPTWFISRTQSGTWTNRTITTGGVGPDGASAHSSVVSSYIEFDCSAAITGWKVLYETVPGGGTFTWAIDGGSATPISTDGSEAVTMTALLSGDGPIRLTVTDAGSAGVEICSVEAVDSTSGKVTLFKLAHSGARVDHFAALDATKYAAGLAALDLDGMHVEFSANDDAGKIPGAEFDTAYNTVVDRIVAQVDDVGLVGTSPTPENYDLPLSDYTDVAYTIALERRLPFVDLALPFGSTARGVALGTINSSDNLHRTEAGGELAGGLIHKTWYA